MIVGSIPELNHIDTKTPVDQEWFGIMLALPSCVLEEG